VCISQLLVHLPNHVGPYQLRLKGVIISRMNARQLITNSIAPAQVGDIDAYIRWSNSVPLLSLEEEMELARRLKEKGGVDAAHKLVLPHLRYVVRIAKGYMGYGLQLADLIQEGNIGLMKSVKRFDPDRKVRLVSFAVHWIKAEIHEHILRNWRIVKVATTKAQRKLFFNLRSKKSEYLAQREVDSNLRLEEANAIAQDLGVPVAEVQNMELRLHAKDAPFDAPAAVRDEAEGQLVPADYLASPALDPAVHLERSSWSALAREKLTKALAGLDSRSREIIEERWLQLDGKKLTLHELASRYGLSPERVRQLEKAAIARLKELMAT